MVFVGTVKIRNTVLYIMWLTHESESRSVVSDSLPPHGLYSPWNSPGQNTGVGSRSPLQGIFPTQDQAQVPSLWADSLPSEPQGSL